MSFWCHQFLQENEGKQVDLRFHSSKVELVRSLIGRNDGLKSHFNFFWPLLALQNNQEMSNEIKIKIDSSSINKDIA